MTYQELGPNGLIVEEDVVMRLSDWLSCEVIGGFLRQFPQKHRVEAARCACRIGVTCLWGWTTSQKQWSLEDLLEVTASINPQQNGGGTKSTASPRQAPRRQDVVAQPWAAARAPEARVPADVNRPVAPRTSSGPEAVSSTMPQFANGSSGGNQGSRGAIKSPQRHASEETLNQRPVRSPLQNSQRGPQRSYGTGATATGATATVGTGKRRGSSQDSGVKDLNVIHNASTASLPDRRPSNQARPSAMTFTTARRAGVSSAVQLPGNANAAVPRTRVQRVVQAASPSGHRGRNGYRRVGQSQSPEGHGNSVSLERVSSPSGSPGTPRQHAVPVSAPQMAAGGRMLVPTLTVNGTAPGAPRVTTQAPLKRHTLGGPFTRRN